MRIENIYLAGFDYRFRTNKLDVMPDILDGCVVGFQYAMGNIFIDYFGTDFKLNPYPNIKFKPLG